MILKKAEATARVEREDMMLLTRSRLSRNSEKSVPTSVE